MNKVIDTLKFYKPKFIIQWNHWGRTMAMAGSQLLLVGGFLSLFYGFPFQFLIGIYSMIIGMGLYAFSYPFEILRKKGFVHIFQKFAVVGPALVVASIPGYFSLPTIIGAVATGVSGTFYTVAALRKEKCLNKEQVMKGGRI